MKAIFAHLKTLLSDGQYASFARHGAFLSLLVFLGLDIYAVIVSARGGMMPALPSRDQLLGQAAILSCLYGVGKAGETAQAFAQQKDDDQQAKMSHDAKDGQ